jgi:hypothetical protein
MARIARSIVPMFFCMIIVLVVFVVGACSRGHAENMPRQVVDLITMCTKRNLNNVGEIPLMMVQ